MTAEREYRFDEHRRYRFDFAIPAVKVAVEVQGGVWSGGAHGRGSGIVRDYDKINLAQLLGWIVLLFDVTAVRDGRALATIQMALEKCKEGEL